MLISFRKLVGTTAAGMALGFSAALIQSPSYGDTENPYGQPMGKPLNEQANEQAEQSTDTQRPEGIRPEGQPERRNEQAGLSSDVCRDRQGFIYGEDQAGFEQCVRENQTLSQQQPPLDDFSQEDMEAGETGLPLPEDPGQIPPPGEADSREGDFGQGDEAGEIGEPDFEEPPESSEPGEAEPYPDPNPDPFWDPTQDPAEMPSGE